MCEKALEIQRQWVQSHGDVFITETGKIAYWISHIHELQKIKKGFVVRTEDDVIQFVKSNMASPAESVDRDGPGSRKKLWHILQAFFNWADTPYRRNAEPAKMLFLSMEQIWLAFVMQKNSGKQWKDFQWIKMNPC